MLGRLRDADTDADAEVARQVDSEPWLNSANELSRWSVRKRGVWWREEDDGGSAPGEKDKSSR